MPDYSFWQGKQVFVTGHTGFVGTWLCLWLHRLGAVVTGYSDELPTTPSMYRLCGLEHIIPWTRGDIRDSEKLTAALRDAKPEVVFHLAGQSEHQGKRSTVEIFDVNVAGMAALLDAVRIVHEDHPIRAVVAMTAADCYAPRDWVLGYREADGLGGAEPGSASKACAELVVSSFRRAYFAGSADGPAVATVRAGHLIGGGDFASGRLVPDCVRAAAGERAAQPDVQPRPSGFRPWLHVLEALAGSLALAQRLFPPGGGGDFAEAWNLGPRTCEARTSAWLAEALRARLGGKQPAPAPSGGAAGQRQQSDAAPMLLDTTKAASRLGWRPRWDAQQTAQHTADWYAAWMQGAPMRDISVSQIVQYET
ncbi:CDP-glucose 4,6-dehydratase [Paenibacillus lignilyticus]|uniref:CDP-glucose 4,6-dehydratase n=1 Tax=Paenibacillus lignilyticus TaxID=1172615 RepID=A0ABS5CF91_9BACL|nr:CDP-glucose 4,6-dehydratase [Paenibacillus lignilyticus]MBP3964520.1 CDP-glucose 4,6-dehydratase [Paenibacillus lignilyticus]